MLKPTTRKLIAALLLGPGLATASVIGKCATAEAAPITEDDPRWVCSTMGDRICGPGNSNGIAPGLYDSAGQLVSPWPTATLCDHLPTLPDLMLGTANCRTEFVAPALVRVTGWPA